MLHNEEDSFDARILLSEITDEDKMDMIAYISGNSINDEISTYEDKPFVIVESWDDLGKLQEAINAIVNPRKFVEFYPMYMKEYGNFEEMRFGDGDKNSQYSKPPYLIPDGLIELDDFIEWGFSDEYVTCSNCYKVICITPGYYGDQPEYDIRDGNILCGECLAEDPEEYIEDFVNNPKKSLNLGIVDISQFGWRRIDIKFQNGLFEGNDDPKKISELLKGIDHIYVMVYSQFYVDFWVYVRDEDVGRVMDRLEKY